MNALLKLASDEFGDLVTISAASEFSAVESGAAGRFDEWCFEFRHGTVYVAVEPDDDSVRLLADGAGYPYVVRITDQKPWNAMVGCSLRWGWLLTNQRGYTDGAQFEFSGESQSWTIQLVAEASQLTAYSLAPLSLMSNLF
jgi:Family of unknown function (DUF6334)